MPPGLTLYRTVTRLLRPLIGPVLAWRAKSGKEDPARRHERYGKRLPERPEGRVVWLHAASVGESQLQVALARELADRHADLSFVFTCQTLTGANTIRKALDQDDQLTGRKTLQLMAPIDTPGISKNFITHFQPALAVFAEGDVWPNQLLELERMACPTALINARMTENSIIGWQRWPRTAKRLFGSFNTILAADMQTATGLSSLSGTEVPCIGNLKSTLPPPDAEPSELENLQNLLPNRPVLLAASTHAGEEALVLDAWMQLDPRPFLIVAPRHPERGDEVMRVLKCGNFNISRRTHDDDLGKDTDILLADTMGEMGLWYRLADTVYLGGGHSPGVGGHNPLEPLRLGKRVLTGPSVFNFHDMMDTLADKGLVKIVDDATALVAAIPQPQLSQAEMDDISSNELGPMRATLDAIDALLDSSRRDV